MAGPLIGALRVSLSAETASFEAGMKRAQRQTQASASAIQRSLGFVKTGLAGLAAGLSVGVLVRAGRDALEYAGHLKEMADTLGLTTKDFQTFSYAAGQVGISQEELEVGIQKLTISMGKAQLGSQAQVKAFNAVGISIDQLRGKNAGEVFRLIAEKLEKVTDRSQRAAVEVALFGKAGAKLDNLLSGAQGRISELSDAAERLGIVLSDEQIQKADETADKIAALETVLKARIAGVVADNADSILDLANALVKLVGMLGGALRAYQAFVAGMNIAGGKLKALDPTNSASGRASGRLQVAVGEAQLRDLQNQQRGGSSAADRAARFRRGLGLGGAPKPATGVNLDRFLAGGGSKPKKAREDHSAQDALRDAYQFDQELRRAQMDVLQATQQLSTDYVERTTIGIDILNAEKAGFDAEQQYQAALFKLTKGKEGQSDAQLQQLKAEYDKKDALERQALLADEETRRAEDVAMLNQTDFDIQKDKLQSELQNAETAEEQRVIQLQLLDLSYRQERARLQAVLADEKASDAAKEDARRRLLGLNATYGNDRQAVLNNTRGPMEDYLASLPTTAAKLNEAMERLQVEGFEGLIDSVLALSEGVGSATDSLLQTLKSFVLGLARLELQKALAGILQGGGGAGGILGSLAGLFGGSGGFDSASFASTVSSNGAALGVNFASGGSGIFKGIPGRDRNILSLNGIPFANVSYGERMTISNDNSSRSMGRGGNVYMTVNTPDADSFRRSEGQTTRSLRRKLA